jgi:catechol 2,3-dioxygenase-like lactoylglutathione lyase family enzyme
MDDQRQRRHRIRIARPVRDLAVSAKFYEQVLELVPIGGFEDDEGYSGVFLGPLGADWHLELTRHASGKPEPTFSAEDLLVLYYSRDRLPGFWARIEMAGVKPIVHENPYWDSVDATVFADPDGYLIVVCPERSD